MKRAVWWLLALATFHLVARATDANPTWQREFNREKLAHLNEVDERLDSYIAIVNKLTRQRKCVRDALNTQQLGHCDTVK